MPKGLLLPAKCIALTVMERKSIHSPQV